MIMKFKILLLIACILIYSCKSKKDWTTFSLYDNRIEVLFPSDDIKKDTIINVTEIGNVITYKYLFES
jgi:hypothetical protein